MVNDGSSNSVGVTSTITVADVNDAPAISGAGSTLAYTLGDSATIIDATLTIADVDDTNIESATVTITGGLQPTEDILAFTNTNEISGNWTSSTGTLALTGTATLAQYEAALESITYRNSDASSSNTSDRTITWIVNDGDTNSSPVTSTVSLSAPSLNHYAVSYTADGSSFADASGPNCAAIPVTIVAHDVSDSAVTADTTVTLTTSSGNGIWVSNGTSSIDLAFGGATSVTTYLRHTTAGTTTINVTDGTISEGGSEDPTYTVSAASLDLVFYKDTDQNGVPDGAGDDIGTLTAGSAYNRLLVGVVDGAAACTQDASIANQTLTTRLAYECINPGTCIRDKDASAGATAIEDNASGATITYTDVSLTYSATGFAPFTLTLSLIHI